MIAPSKAMPSEPPTCRMLFRTADPTPALSTGTELIAVAVVGLIDIAMPAPPISSAGRMSQKFECSPRRANRSSEPETRVIPAPTSQREPTRSVIRPAIGATSTISTVIGRNVAPAFVAE